jgi:hypothetical protein
MYGMLGRKEEILARGKVLWDLAGWQRIMK